MSVLVFVELDNGQIKKLSQEAIAYGAAIAAQKSLKTVVLAIGNSTPEQLAEAGAFGADTVIHAQGEKLSHENSMAYADVLAQVVAAQGSEMVIMSKSGLGDATAARLAPKIKAALVSGVCELPSFENGLQVKRSIYTGKAFATVSIQSAKTILVIKKNAVAFSPSDKTASVEAFSPAIGETNFVATVTSVEKAQTELSLTEADIVVSGGRGMKGPDTWQPVLDLAKALRAATGCSKPVSDLDWRPHHEHIGQTGIKVAPNLYIACGISGAIQHLAGVNGSKCIVVINKDPEAPFFKAADYGIVGDVFEVLPRLTKAVESLNS
jgi:electron transfer flavoprotein alpha subunit